MINNQSKLSPNIHQQPLSDTAFRRSKLYLLSLRDVVDDDLARRRTMYFGDEVIYHQGAIEIVDEYRISQYHNHNVTNKQSQNK